ncbi:MAG: hypothetical protein P9M14_00930 [Candidatus Alcyoniella australis]|nr:hypothetical protein [Candidatus Alcyoniella australis]
MTTDRARRVLRLVAWAALGLLITIVLTYPVALRPGTHLPSDLGDPLLNSWILWWDFEHLLSLDFNGYWNAPIFHPLPHALTLSEHLLGAALLATPIYAVSGNQLLAYNLLLLFTFFAALTGGAALARHLGRSWIASWLCGMIFAFCSHRYAQLPHLQVLFGGLAPWTMLFLLRLTEKPRLRDSLGLLVSLWLISFSCLYHAAFFSVLLILACAMLFCTRRLWTKPRSLALIALPALLVGLSMLPVIHAYRQGAQYFGLQRSLADAAFYSAHLSSFLASSEHSRLLGLLSARWRGPEGELYPGIVAASLALALFGLALRKARREGGRGLRRTIELTYRESGGDVTLLFVLLGLAALLFTLGPELRLHGKILGPGPYLLLYKFVPGFQSIRVPPRFATYLMLSLAVLASGGLDALLHRIPRRGVALVIGLAALALCTAENLSIPLRCVAVPQVPAVYEQLDDLPPGALLELPLNREYRFPDVIYQHYQTVHRRPLINGYSGFFPQHRDELLRALAADRAITPLLERQLREADPRYLVVHQDSPEWDRNGQLPAMFLESALFVPLLVDGPITILVWRSDSALGELL